MEEASFELWFASWTSSYERMIFTRNFNEVQWRSMKFPSGRSDSAAIAGDHLVHMASKWAERAAQTEQ